MTVLRQIASFLLPVGALACLLGGCGARTGLNLPDAQVLNSIDAGELDGGMDASMDASVDAAMPLPCIEIPFQGGPVQVALQTQAQIGRADVVFLVDSTASMQDEIATIRSRLANELVPAIHQAIPDSEIGVATFQDFPVGNYGAPTDVPFRLMTPVTGDLAQAQAGVSQIRIGDGLDFPESQVEALYQLVTGQGLPPFVPPSQGCPSGGVGYACFRTDALPVIMLFTDAAFHNGPTGDNPYGPDVVPTPHSYFDMVNAVRHLDARVIGFGSGSGDRGDLRDMRALALATGAVDRSGNPLVYDIGTQGQRLGTGVVTAIQTFASDAQFDVGVQLHDPLPGDGVDVTSFVQQVIPLRADPPSGVQSIDTAAGVFRGVRAGTQVVFELVLRNDAVVPGTQPKVFALDVIFQADGRVWLATQTVDLVIPAADGLGCPPGTTLGG